MKAIEALAEAVSLASKIIDYLEGLNSEGFSNKYEQRFRLFRRDFTKLNKHIGDKWKPESMSDSAGDTIWYNIDDSYVVLYWTGEDMVYIYDYCSCPMEYIEKEDTHNIDDQPLFTHSLT